MCVWAYGTIYSSWLGGLISVVTTHSLCGDDNGTINTFPVSLCETPMAIEACSRACLKGCTIACLIACLRELHFEHSRVFHKKLLADGKL
jgi:hypothetical protein